jgi:hypothetical protein
MTDALLHNHAALQTLTQLARRSREASSTAELGFVLVNETHALMPYRQAVLWQSGYDTMISGVTTPEANGPYMLWLKQLFQHLQNEDYKEPHRLTPDQLPKKIARDWHNWLPKSVLFLPMAKDGGLLLVRDNHWHDSDIGTLQEWLAIWQQSKQLLNADQGFWQKLQSSKAAQPVSWLKSLRLWLAVIVLASLFVPVRLSVLAPAELIPFEPQIVRAPLDGVIADITIEPYQSVQQQTPLFHYDQTEINNRLQITGDALRLAKTEYRQKAQQALFDARLKGDLALLQARISERQQELEYLHTLKQRGMVEADREGLVLFEDASSWEGRPVITGEKVMVIAAPEQVEIEAWLAPDDLIEFGKDKDALLYLNARPLQPISAQLRYVAHEASIRPDGHYAYRIRARLQRDNNLPRLGLKGTLKLYGDEVTLGYWIFRRPLASLRTWLGW